MAFYPDQQRSWAVLAGTSDYAEQSHLDHLPGVHNNLVALERALTNSDTGVFAPERCTVVSNPDTPRSFMSRLRRAAGQAEDVLFVYYAGHGVLGGRNADLYLTVRETDEYQPESTAVAFDAVSQVIEDSPAKTKILILDCCFSGRAIGAMSSDSAALSKINVSGTYILTSTEANRESRAVPGERYTAFTGELLSILSDGLPGRQTDVLLADLYAPLQAAMARRGFPRPRNAVGDTSGNVVVRRARELTPAPAAPPVAEAAVSKPPQPPTQVIEEASPEPRPQPSSPPPDVRPPNPGKPAANSAPREPGHLPPRAYESTPAALPQSGRAVRPLISDDSLREIGRGLGFGVLWILFGASTLLFAGSIGAAASGAYRDTGAAVAGLVVCGLFFAIFGSLLLRRYLYRRAERKPGTTPYDSPVNGSASVNELRKQFFEQTFALLRESYPTLRTTQAKAAHECFFASGPFGYYSLTFSKLGFRVEVHLDTGDKTTTMQLFDNLHRRRHEVEAALGFEPVWEELPENRASRISSYLADFDLPNSDPFTRQKAAEWTAKRVSAMHRTLDGELRRISNALKSK